MNCNVLILAVSRLIPILKINIPYIRQNIHPKQIVVIGAERLKTDIQGLKEDVVFIDEDKLLKGLSYAAIEKIVSSKDLFATARAGWYFQQFLKMAYAFICQDDYYFVLDADTIPVRQIDMFNSQGIPFFDIKAEYNAPYFTTMKKLVGMKKAIESSFIAEHMIFKTEYMLELIRLIEANSDIKGISFFEKAINAIRVIDLPKSGFSEFETYGTFVHTTHTGSYEFRRLESLRNADKFLGAMPDALMLRWASKSYALVTFENRRLPGQNLLDYVRRSFESRSLEEIVRENSFSAGR